MRRYDLILYDLDGTVWDSVPMILDCFKKAYIKVFGKCDRTDEDLKSYIGRPLPETFAMHDPETAQAVLEAYYEVNGKKLMENSIKLFDGVMDELKRIKDLGIPQGYVTSKRIESAGITLRMNGLDDFFDVGICKDDTVRHKPDAEPLVTAAAKLGISDMTKVVYIGDALPDAQCAANAGADFALVDWSEMDKDAILAAAPSGSRIISKFSDVL